MSLEEMTKIDNLKSWTSGVEVEWEAVQQLRNIAALPILAGHVAVMPDVHLGKGATVGSVIPTKAAIIPSAVGVDIGCGMAAVRTAITANDLPDSLRTLRSRIEQRVPVGFSSHDVAVNPVRDGVRGVQLAQAGKKLHERFGQLKILDVIRQYDPSRTFKQLGTLGGGNHFIELCLDESNAVWVMLHSGSRNIGKTIGETAISMAREIAERKERKLRDRDLAWLDEGSVEFEMYIEGLRWAQDYAAHNRALMLHAVLNALHEEFGREIATFENAVQCHHNYAIGRRALRPAGLGDAQGRGIGASRRARHHPGLDGRQVVHRARQGQRGFVLLVLARCGSSVVPRRCEADLHARGSRRSRPPASSAARTKACSTKSRVPTRASMQSWLHRPSSSMSSIP